MNNHINFSRDNLNPIIRTTILTHPFVFEESILTHLTLFQNTSNFKFINMDQ